MHVEDLIKQYVEDKRAQAVQPSRDLELSGGRIQWAIAQGTVPMEPSANASPAMEKREGPKLAQPNICYLTSRLT